MRSRLPLWLVLVALSGTYLSTMVCALSCGTRHKYGQAAEHPTCHKAKTSEVRLVCSDPCDKHADAVLTAVPPASIGSSTPMVLPVTPQVPHAARRVLVSVADSSSPGPPLQSGRSVLRI